MKILLDWGNTNLKILKVEASSDGDLEELSPISLDNPKQLKSYCDGVTDIVVASVRSDDENQSLYEECSDCGIFPLFAKVEKNFDELVCGYSDPNLLGIDRWLALIATYQNDKNVGVIDLGTAITIDIIKGNQHLGGHILPNKSLIMNSIFKTARVRPNILEANVEDLQLGLDTTECVNYAIDFAIQSYLEKTITELDKKYTINQWIVTGGAGMHYFELISNQIQNCIYNKNLIFQGLNSYFKKKSKKTNN